MKKAVITGVRQADIVDSLSLYHKIMQVTQGSPVIPHLISHTFPMSQIQQAFEVSASQQNAKIILHPWE